MKLLPRLGVCTHGSPHRRRLAEFQDVACHQIRGSIVVSISACHAEDPGSIPGRGVFPMHSSLQICQEMGS